MKKIHLYLIASSSKVKSFNISVEDNTRASIINLGGRKNQQQIINPKFHKKIVKEMEPKVMEYLTIKEK